MTFINKLLSEQTNLPITFEDESLTPSPPSPSTGATYTCKLKHNKQKDTFNKVAVHQQYGIAPDLLLDTFQNQFLQNKVVQFYLYVHGLVSFLSNLSSISEQLLAWLLIKDWYQHKAPHVIEGE